MGLISFHADENLKTIALNSKNFIFEPKVLEESFGIPGWICKIKSLFFDVLKKDEGDKFYLDLIASMPVGVNLQPLKWKFLSYMITQCIGMLKSQLGGENFLRGRNEFIPYLEKTKSYYDLMFINQLESDESYDFDLISRTLAASLPRGLAEKESHDIYAEHYKKLMELFKKEERVLFFNFKKEDHSVSVNCNEKTQLIPSKKSSKIIYLKSIIKRMMK